MPDYDTIREYYLTGKWNDAMLRTALVCKAITQEQYDALVAEKAAQEAGGKTKTAKKGKK